MSGGCLMADPEEFGMEKGTRSSHHYGAEPCHASLPELQVQNLQGGLSHRSLCASSSPPPTSCGDGVCRAECGRGSKDNQGNAGGVGRQANGDGITQPKEGAACGGGGGQLCVKCGVNPAELIANQREPYCGACLGHSLLYKFKTAVNKHALIQAQDAVLLAFSGGHASTVLLHFLRDLQSHATTPQAAAADRGKTVFRLGVLFVNEASVLSRPGYDGQQVEEDIRRLAAPLAEQGCAVHVVGLEHIFEHSQGPPTAAAQEQGTARHCSGKGARQGNRSSATESRVEERKGDESSEHSVDASVGAGMLTCPQQRLRAVVCSVQDATAQEDLVELLRMEVLQKVAAEYGYSKIAVGLCATRLAARVLTGTVKGRGFSLPADLQFVDRRRAVPVVAPLRDCVLKELALLCQLNKWPSVFVPSLDAGPQPCASLNRLTQDFLTLIEDDLPGRTHTILRTAGKLQPFPINAFPALPPGQRARLQPVQAPGASPLQAGQCIPLCALCRAPLSDWERAAAEESGREEQDGEGGRAKGLAAESRGNGGEGQGLAAERASAGRVEDEGLPRGSLGDVPRNGGKWQGEEDEQGGVGSCCRSCCEQVVGESRSGRSNGWLAHLPWMQPGQRVTDRRANMRIELAAFLLDDDGT